MPGNMISNSDKPYLRIVGGNLVQKVDEDTKGAKLRRWKTPEGKEGSTWELTYMNWTGKIKSIINKETQYGEVCNIDFGDAVLTLNTSSKYFSDLVSKLFNADLRSFTARA